MAHRNKSGAGARIVRRSAGTASLLKEAARALLDRPCRSSANIISDEGPCSFRYPPSTTRSRGPRCLQHARSSGVPERSGRVPYIRLPTGDRGFEPGSLQRRVHENIVRLTSAQEPPGSARFVLL